MLKLKLLSLFLAVVSFASLRPTVSLAQDGQPGYQSGPSPYGPPPGYSAPPPGYAPPPDYNAPPPSYGPAYYPPARYAPPVGYHEHDGFYLRLQLGVGYLHAGTNESGQSVSCSGVGGTIGLAIGGAIARNLILYGEIYGTSVSDPTLSSGGASMTGSGLTETFAGLGPGVAYYLDDNLYLSGTLLFSRLDFSDSDTTDTLASTDVGIGTVLSVGKEWWVTGDWGIGVAGQFAGATMKDQNDGPRWNIWSLALVFSATYN